MPSFWPRKGTDALVTVGTGRFLEGLACVRERDADYGYINKKGEYVIPPRFYRAQEFSEGLAWAAGEDGKVGWHRQNRAVGRDRVEGPGCSRETDFKFGE